MPERIVNAGLFGLAGANRGTVVVDTIADEWPAVVVTGDDKIDLIATLGAVLLFPQPAVSRVDSETLRIAMTIRPDFGTRARLVDEWIVGRRHALGRNPDDLAEVIIERLRHVTVDEMLAIGEEQCAICCLYDATSEMASPRRRTMLAIDDLNVGKPWHLAGLELGARHCGAPSALEGFGVREINGAVLRKIAVEDDVKQAALADRKHVRHVAERRGELTIRWNNAHAAGALGHQHAAVGKESKRPGVHQALPYGADREFAGCARKSAIISRLHGAAQGQNDAQCQKRPHAGPPSTPP